jgi:hypothetical protein
MRFLREPWRFVIIWTLACAIPVYLLIVDITRPIAPGCWDMCDLSAAIGRFILAVIAVVWLAVTGLALWLYRGRSN